MEHDKIRHLLIRMALSVVFIIFGLWEIINPQYWQGFVPGFVRSMVSNLHPLVQIHGAVLLIVGLMILLGFYMRIASIIAGLMLLEITVSLILESGFSDLFVRDLALLILAVALYFDSTRHLSINKY